jgi:hypothetical protein
VVNRPGNARFRPGLLCCAAWLLALLAPALATAQPVAVFELDDYLDPRLLGTEFQENGGIEPGHRFVVGEMLAGVISDFEHQGFYSAGQTEFTHVTARLYQGRSQFNLLATVFNPRTSPVFGQGSEESPGTIPGGERARVIPDYQLRLQYGLYQLTPGTADNRFIDRLLFSVGYARTNAGDQIYNLGMVFDIDIPIKALLGSVGYDWRIVDGGFDQHRLLYFYRWSNEDVIGRVSLPVRLSFGGERSEAHWRLAPVRLEMGVKVPVERLRTTIHLTYAPSFRPASRGFEQGWNHEFAAFLDVMPLTKVLISARRQP